MDLKSKCFVLSCHSPRFLLVTKRKSVISNNNSGMIGVGYVNRFQIGAGLGAGFVKKDDINVVYKDVNIPKLPNMGIAAAPTAMFAFNLGWLLGKGPYLNPPSEEKVKKNPELEEDEEEEEVYRKYAKKIFQTAMPQSSIRPRVMKKVSELKAKGDFFSIEYVPRSGKNKGNVYEQFYKGENFRLLAWLGDVSEEIDGFLYKKELQGTLWDFASETKNLSKEGGVQFPNGKKPLALIKRFNNRITSLIDFYRIPFTING